MTCKPPLNVNLDSNFILHCRTAKDLRHCWRDLSAEPGTIMPEAADA